MSATSRRGKPRNAQLETQRRLIEQAGRNPVADLCRLMAGIGPIPSREQVVELLARHSWQRRRSA